MVLVDEQYYHLNQPYTMAIVNLVYNSFPTEIIVIFCFVFKPFNILRSPHQQQINQKKIDLKLSFGNNIS